MNSDIFKKIKPNAEEEISRRFHEIESELNVKIPNGFLRLVKEIFETRYPNNQEEFYDLISSIHGEFSLILDYLELTGEKLDLQCMDFVDKLIIQLYEKTNGKGMGNELWSHFPKIWYLQQIASDMERINSENFSIEYRLNLAFKSYEDIYELTIAIITSIALKIADEQRKEDLHSKNFCKLYRKRKTSDRTISKRELSDYFNTQEFLKGWGCLIIEESSVRNKIAHFDYYYDMDKKIIKLGNKEYTIMEFKIKIEQMNNFYCYMLFKCFKEANMHTTLAALLNINKQTNDK